MARVGFLPWQKVFLPGQWKKLVKTGKNWKTRSMLLVLGLNSSWQFKKAKFVKA
jgi:hypothetical protein